VFDVLIWLSYLPVAAVLVAGFIILWRARRRSQRATSLAFGALCGLGGLWLLAIVLRAMWRDWQTTMSTDTWLTVIGAYSLAYACANATCIMLLVLAAVTDRRSPTRDNMSGPAADFDDAAVDKRTDAVR